MRSLPLVLVCATLGVSALAGAEAPTIDHAAVKCIVAGTYPKLTATFAPAPVAQARAYFRPEGVPSWYYVEMAPAVPGYAGVLPKPTRKLVDKHIDYYVEAANKDFDSGRTLEYAPLVVARKEDCKEQPIAAYAAGPPAKVFPSLPEGFAMAGAFPLTAVSVIGGGAAVAGTVLALRDDAPTTLRVIVDPTPPIAPPTAPTPTPSAVPGTGLRVTCQAVPRTGVAPLRVAFDVSTSGGTGVYDYVWDFGDGETSPQVGPAHTYTRPGSFVATVAATSGAESGRCQREIAVAAAARDYELTVLRPGTGTGTVTGPGINCGNDCSETLAAGSVIQLAAAAGPGSSFLGWGGACSGTAECVVTMSGPQTVSANFGPQATLTVTLAGAGNGTVTGPGIACPGTCTGQYPTGSTVTLTATPTSAGGSAFSGWSGACTGTGPCPVTMNGNQAVTATFVPLTALLTVTRAGTGAASGAAIGPGINCGGDCTETYPSGTNVALQPSTAPSGLPVQFDGWSGDCGGTGTCNLVMTTARNVVANFTELLTLFITVSGPGSVSSAPPGIDCTPDCSEAFPSGSNVTLTANPDLGATFVSWNGDCAKAGPVCVLTLTQSQSLIATFTGGTRPSRAVPEAAAAGWAWSSLLEVEGGWGRVFANGADAGTTAPGQTRLAVPRRAGANRVEAQLQAGAGKPGTWRFELLDKGALEPGSLRVLEGEVLLVTEEAVVFRLAGRAGERVAFTFRAKP